MYSTRSPLFGLIATLMCGCAAVPSDQLYQDLGGYEGIQRLTENLLLESAREPLLADHFYTANMDRVQVMLADQICELAGGPCVYRGYSMREAHAAIDISDAAFNVLVETLIEVMDDEELPVAVQNHLLALLAPMHADVTAGHRTRMRSTTTVHESTDSVVSPELGTPPRQSPVSDARPTGMQTRKHKSDG